MELSPCQAKAAMNRCADATFLIDAIRGDPGASEKVREMQLTGEPLRSPAPAVAELLLGAFLHSGKKGQLAVALAREVETLPVDYNAAEEAARMAGALHRIGRALPMLDVLVAATAVINHLALLSRDRGLRWIERLVVEDY